MSESADFLREHLHLTRRFFLAGGSAGLIGGWWSNGTFGPSEVRGADLPSEADPLLSKIDSYFTAPGKFGDVSRGKPIPHTLPLEKKKEVGLTRETWKLEITSDPDHPATLGKQFTKKDGSALDFDQLVKLGEKHAVRFGKIMTCLNMGCPLGVGIWEGVPLRTLVWMTQPKENLRRVHYWGYHNDDPKQIFRSSLPIGRILEDYDDLPPVIACYKLNGEWLTPERGAPVRIVVPEHYGFKSVKWLTNIVLSNQFFANDTYGAQNNDVDSPMKTFSATLHVPAKVKARSRFAVTGYAQSGISGLAKVQVWVSPADTVWKADDPYFQSAPWSDAVILPPPTVWGGDLPGGAIPKNTFGFDEQGKPKTWPMRLARAHWAVILPGLPVGKYVLRSRTVDTKGQAQPMPRPFKKSGRCDIEAVKFEVEA